VLYDLLKFSQNRIEKILFSSRLKKGQEKAKWPNHFISRKLFQKGQMATLSRDLYSHKKLALLFLAQEVISNTVELLIIWVGYSIIHPIFKTND
jgi:hypothetical protein